MHYKKKDAKEESVPWHFRFGSGKRIMFQHPLNHTHRTEAKGLNEFYGVEMSSLYTDVDEEFDAAANEVALIDRSWIGRIEVTGADRIDLLHRLSTNDLRVGKHGQGISTVFTTEKGRIVDYVYVLVRDSSLLLLTSPTNEAIFAQWIEKYTIMEDIRFNAVTQSSVMVSLIGPKAKAFTESATGSVLEANRFVELRLPCCQATLLYRQEFQTAIVDIVVDAVDGVDLWRFLTARSDESKVKKMGTRAYETFRISRGIPAIGSELNADFNPYEVGLVHAISYTKGCYIGQEVIARLDTYQKVQKNLCGMYFSVSSHQLKSGLEVLHNGEAVGVLTSVSKETIRGKTICVGTLKKNVVHTDDHISVVCNGTTFFGAIHSLPVVP